MYRTPEWRRLRAGCLKAEPLCRECRRAGRATPATTADHITPHRGDPALFFNAANLQPLCDVHHGDKQRIEHGGRPRTPVGVDGWPLQDGR
jgi:5-methylcytosine-specific restriction endonuclease McrA